MSPAFFQPESKIGRPRQVELTPAQGMRLAEIYKATNRNRKEGSMEAAWVLFAEETGLWPWTHKNHRIVGSLPAAALEWLRKGKGLVPAARGGAKELRLKGPYQQGGMRLHWEEDRRLRAGESYSVDDLTRNVAVWIPWPHGGCECSEKFGVRLGRWQTLVVCDDATFAIPAVSSVFRYAASYQGSDAASIIYQTERDVGMAGFGTGESRWIVEGGVWQSKRALTALAGRFHSAKGRPMQKLIERWFGAVQTLDAVWNRDLGRQRGEILENNQLWLDCRAGKKDPRDFFPSFQQGHETLIHAIQYMNEREVRSNLYGRWVPQERWQRDTEAHPLTRRSEADAWVMMPELRTLKVSRAGQVQCSVIMADGITRTLVWNAAWLYEWLGRKIELHFDPLGEWPLEAICTAPGTRRILGTATCQNPFGASRDADRERVAAIRRTMMSDLRIILGSNAGTRTTAARGLGGTIEIRRNETNLHRSEADHLADREKNHGESYPAAVPEPRHTTVAVETSHVAGASGSCLPVAGASGSRHTAPLTATGRRASTPHVGDPEWDRREIPAPGSGTVAGVSDSGSPHPRGTPAEPLRSIRRKAAEARDLTPNW